jgi:hypothetical protein
VTITIMMVVLLLMMMLPVMATVQQLFRVDSPLARSAN